jgi:uncharacterized membrane protein
MAGKRGEARATLLAKAVVVVGEEHVSEPHEWLRWLMDHIEGQVAFGDTKAGLLLAADSILLAALGSLITADHPGFASLSSVAKVLLGLSFVALIIALVLGLQTILPSRKNLRARNASRSESVHVDFSLIARQSPESFMSAALQANRAELDTDIAKVINGKASWAKRKFTLLYFAVIATQLAVALGFSAAVAQLLAR